MHTIYSELLHGDGAQHPDESQYESSSPSPQNLMIVEQTLMQGTANSSSKLKDQTMTSNNNNIDLIPVDTQSIKISSTSNKKINTQTLSHMKVNIEQFRQMHNDDSLGNDSEFDAKFAHGSEIKAANRSKRHNLISKTHTKEISRNSFIISEGKLPDVQTRMLHHSHDNPGSLRVESSYNAPAMETIAQIRQEDQKIPKYYEKDYLRLVQIQNMKELKKYRQLREQSRKVKIEKLVQSQERVTSKVSESQKAMKKVNLMEKYRYDSDRIQKRLDEILQVQKATNFPFRQKHTMTELNDLVKSDLTVGMDVIYRARIKEENPNQLRIIAPFLDSAIRNRANKSIVQEASKDAIKIREGSNEKFNVKLNPSSAERASSQYLDSIRNQSLSVQVPGTNINSSRFKSPKILVKDPSNQHNVLTPTGIDHRTETLNTLPTHLTNSIQKTDPLLDSQQSDRTTGDPKLQGLND